ncbi:hypothetical protein [Roseisalinus antarcticus]|uniref:Uncharacterized protein n=1 Tax=Roseisalinus antarcticus TaxID=254357 RepID=A0A1Y5U235_9RHOB|nr:hypothetical protein [Roseisalinus antarcticus]SLN75266.1 hypothetical protein ROA7023_03930 [Roseisalinus antarcticus]
MIKHILLTAAFALSVSFAQAQDASPAKEDELELARAIQSQASEFAGTIEGLAEQLNSLPEDMAGMEALYDEMIAEVDAMLLLVSSESDLATGVVTLRETAEGKRTEWQERCDNTSNNRDCARVALWDTRVAKAIEQQDRFGSIVDEMQSAREIIVENRTYGIDDLELRLFDVAQEGLETSLDQMSVIAGSMTDLANAVGGPDFEGQETN